MSHKNRIYISVATILITSAACVVPAISTPDTAGISTAAAQTVIAGLTQNAPLVMFSPTLEIMSTTTTTFTPETPTFTPTLTSTLTQTNTPTQTFTSTETITPTQTFTPTLTLVPTLVFTPTMETTLITVSVATNCRAGPGKVYPIEGALLIGKTTIVYARNSSNDYWYIRNPDVEAEFCWVWGGYATVLGPSMLLPVFTPPPTPTATLTPLPTITPTPSPDFKAEYVALDKCAASWWGEIMLKNTGSIPFKSINISVNDKATDVVAVNLADGFTNIDGCLKTTTKDVIGIGDTYLISAPAFAYNPTGHKIRVVITLCSETGQKGICATNNFSFKP
jgi:hypothetical protein